MDAHHNIEVRIYNPVRPGRRFGIKRLLSFLMEFSRLNLRMHNKIFLVDNCITIAGGRNIGDEYFDYHPVVNFIDLDMLVVGRNVPDVAESFEVYWNSPSALPLSVLNAKSNSSTNNKRELLNRLAAHHETTYPFEIGAESFNQRLDECLSEMIWAESDFVYDLPMNEGDEAKSSDTGFVWQRLSEEFTKTQKQILIESAYFIALDRRMRGVFKARDAGIDVSVLTNSLVSNDLWLMHAGYSAKRHRLLGSGIKLYEFRPDAEVCKTFINQKHLCKKSRVSLHTKSIVFDDNTAYVGSFNLNPRSAYLNSEIAFIIKSEPLAGALKQRIQTNMSPNNSWQAGLDEQQKIQWRSLENGKLQIYHHDPKASIWRRMRNNFFTFFPFDRYY
jgi:putative cardiolipin synthase